MKKPLTYPQKALRIYDALYKLNIGVQPSYALPKYLSILNKLESSYPGAKLLAVTFVHFEWRGVGGTDNHEQERLASKGFPIEWMARNAPLYEAYLRGILGDSAWESEAEVRQHVGDWIGDLKTALNSKV